MPDTRASDLIERAHYGFMPNRQLAEMRDNAFYRHDLIMRGQNATTPAERREATKWNHVGHMAAAELKRRGAA